MPLYLLVLQRLLLSIPTLLLVSMLGFALMRFHLHIPALELPWFGGETFTLFDSFELSQPIDPLANLRTNPQISAEALMQEEARLGLDKPLWEQYILWLTHFIRGELGRTISGESVASLLLDRAKNTVVLNIASMTLTWLVAIPLGVLAAFRWRSLVDRGLTLLSAIGMAAPGFVVALLLGLFVVHTGILPFGGLTSANHDSLSPVGQFFDYAAHLVLPVTVLSLLGIASLQRQMRGNLLDVLQADYIRSARAKGLKEWVVRYKHAVRNALNPLITMLGYEFAALLSGAVLIETVLSFPGLGYLTFQGALQGDANLVMATLVLSAFMLVLGNLLADILQRIVDPRLRNG